MTQTSIRENFFNSLKVGERTKFIDDSCKICYGTVIRKNAVVAVIDIDGQFGYGWITKYKIILN